VVFIAYVHLALFLALSLLPTSVQNLKSLLGNLSRHINIFGGVKFKKTGHVTLTTPLSGMIRHLATGTYYDQSMYQI